jgi:hypothetical protein
MRGPFPNDSKTDELIREFVADGGKPDDWWKSWAGACSAAPAQDAPSFATAARAGSSTSFAGIGKKPANRPKGGPVMNARREKVASGFWTRPFTAGDVAATHTADREVSSSRTADPTDRTLLKPVP